MMMSYFFLHWKELRREGRTVEEKKEKEMAVLSQCAKLMGYAGANDNNNIN